MNGGCCPSQTPIKPGQDKNDPFAYSSVQCRYNEIESQGAASTPKHSVRVRKPQSYNSPDHKYLKYSTLERCDRIASTKQESTKNCVHEVNAGERPPATIFSSRTALNLNSQFPTDISIFPRNIYRKYPFASKSPYLDLPRDTKSMYTFCPDPNLDGHRERSKHTLNQSRFGYNRLPDGFEFLAGPQSRGYVEVPFCHDCAQDTPADVAPERFYDELNLKASPTEFRKMIGMNPIV